MPKSLIRTYFFLHMRHKMKAAATLLVISLLCNFYLYFKLPAKTPDNKIVQHEFTKLRQQAVHKIQQYPQTIHTKLWDHKTAIKDLSVQVGTLTKLHMQLENERPSQQKPDQAIKEEIAHELSDILSLILFISYELNIDVINAWHKTPQK